MKLNIFKKALLIYSICLFSFLAFSIEGKENPKNIVFILADDFGYSDVGYMNQKLNGNNYYAIFDQLDENVG